MEINNKYISTDAFQNFSSEHTVSYHVKPVPICVLLTGPPSLKVSRYHPCYTGFLVTHALELHDVVFLDFMAIYALKGHKDINHRNNNPSRLST